MAFKVTIKNEKGQPISGYLTFMDGVTGEQIPGGTVTVTIANGSGLLPDLYRNSGYNVRAWAIEDRYTDMIMPSANFQDDNDIILEKKPNILLIIVGAAVGGYIIKQLIG